MVYRVIGLMSGSSLDGLDIVYVHFESVFGRWNYQIQQAVCYEYDPEWTEKLRTANLLPAYEYQKLHSEYGHFLGHQVNRFIRENQLQYQVQLIASHGHTTFHDPASKMTAQLGDGAAIAAETGINVISDLRSMDVALGGQGAPIVPIGEKYLLQEYPLFLNLGGIANLSAHIPVAPGVSKGIPDHFIAFDVCPANRVLNMLAMEKGLNYDAQGSLAATGTINSLLFQKLNQFEYYSRPNPKSLANDFGTQEIYPLTQAISDSVENKLSTYVEHICFQVRRSLEGILTLWKDRPSGLKLLVTGGGGHNLFLNERLKYSLSELDVEPVVPETMLVDYKEALIMALIGVLRWREEKNVLSSVTGALRDSIGGAIWIGQEG